MDLKCKKLNCKYNDSCACMSKGIKVARNCECATFEMAEKLDAKQKNRKERHSKRKVIDEGIQVYKDTELTYKNENVKQEIKDCFRINITANINYNT